MPGRRLRGVLALRATTAAALKPAGAHPWLRAGDVGWSSLAIGGLFLFTTVDLFLARHFLPGEASGGYVAAATIGKTLLALPAAALAAAYPRLVAAGSGPARAAELRRTTDRRGGPGPPRRNRRRSSRPASS